MKNPLKQTFRSLFSYTPYTGLLPKPSRRPFGISAIVRVLNDKEIIAACVESIANVVDEIVVVDNGSSDGSWEILNDLKKTVPILKLFQYGGNIPWDFSNCALQKTTFRWILKWDSDFVAGHGGIADITGLRRQLQALDENKYYYINPTLIELSGDFFHQFPDIRFRQDIELFTYSYRAMYARVDRHLKYAYCPSITLPEQYRLKIYDISFEALKIPLFFTLLRFNNPIGFHLNIKSAQGYLLRYFWTEWLAKNHDDYPTLESYVEFFVRTHWKFPDMQSAAKFYINEYAKCLDRSTYAYNDLPENIRRLADNSPYRVIHAADGTITGRNDGIKEQE